MADLTQHTKTQSSPCKNCSGNCCQAFKLNETRSATGDTAISNNTKNSATCAKGKSQ